jgi:benzodiazapine receptor
LSLLGPRRIKQKENELTDRTRWIGLVICIAICLGAGALGAIATTPEIEGWYRTLTKPSWNPPDWIFGPVWTMLYILMAVAAWLVWRPAGIASAATPLMLFAVQLVLNIAWSWIFFGLHQPGWAFGEIVLLWLAIVATTAAFFRSSKIAGWMMLPYLAWVSFAAVLNFTIWRMNS